MTDWKAWVAPLIALGAVVLGAGRYLARIESAEKKCAEVESLRARVERLSYWQEYYGLDRARTPPEAWLTTTGRR